jgi:hypothetical protein
MMPDRYCQTGSIIDDGIFRPGDAAMKAPRESIVPTRPLDIASFEGVKLRAAPVACSNLRETNPWAPTVLVVGSSIETTGRGPAIGSETIRSVILPLTDALARERASLVTCAAPGVSDLVARAYQVNPGRGTILDLVVTSHPGDDETFGAYAPRGFTCHGDISIYCGMPFEVIGCLAAQVCDIVVVISGGLGSVIEVSIAAMRERPIISFVETGGAAEMIAPMLSRFKAVNRSLDVREVSTNDEFGVQFDALASRFRAAGTRTNLAALLDELTSKIEAGKSS